jgi:flavin reductase (DIM6/NTAB) family NADH-FMN oxidoreductase RutF
MSDVSWMLEELWGPIVAVTAEHDGRANGLISSTTVTASLLPELPRLSIQLSRTSLTHDLVLGAGAFAVHLLGADEKGLEIVRTLGFRSGHEQPKLDTFRIHRGVTGVPVLADVVAFVEARVSGTFEFGAVTLVVADVIAGRRVRDARALTIDDVRTRAPAEWLAEWDRRRDEELRAARLLEQGL